MGEAEPGRCTARRRDRHSALPPDPGPDLAPTVSDPPPPTLQVSTSGKAFAGGAAGRGAARLVACNGKAAWKTAIDVMNKELMVKESVFEQAMAIKGVDAWPEWESEVKEFPWSYDQHEEAYITEGAGTVTPDGGEPVDIKAGDFVTFPKGMSCTWDVTEPMKKKYARPPPPCRSGRPPVRSPPPPSPRAKGD